MSERPITRDSATPTHDERELVIKACAGRDMPCPACGYNLRDLKSRVCPECGEALVLSIGTAKVLQHWPYALTLFSLAMCAGCGLPYWIYPVLVDQAVPFWLRRVFYDVTFASFWAALAVLFVPRRFVAWSRSTQWAIATAAMLLMLGVMLVQWWANIARLL